MAVDKRIIELYARDYESVTGEAAASFVCPITGRKCQDSEVIKGHVLNQSYLRASRMYVPQWKALDNFFGDAVEGEATRFFNLPALSQMEQLHACSQLTATLSDGRRLEAFLVSPKAREGAAKRWPMFRWGLEGETVDLFVRSGLAEIGAARVVRLGGSHAVIPICASVALLKSACLALFRLLGYRAFDDPFGASLRLTLTRFFSDRAPRDSALEYFRDFRNSCKILGMGKAPRDLEANYTAFELDSLGDRVFFMHETPAGMLFASTVVFRINETTFGVVVPAALGGLDVDSTVRAWSCYQRLVNGDCDIKPITRFARFEEGAWQFSASTRECRFLNDALRE